MLLFLGKPNIKTQYGQKTTLDKIAYQSPGPKHQTQAKAANVRLTVAFWNFYSLERIIDFSA